MTRKSLHNSGTIMSGLEDIQAVLAPLIASPKDTAIFLDLDGTLAPISPKPESVAVPAPIGKLVRTLSHMYLAVSIVSGRPATEAKRIVGNGELAYIGNHGFETMLPGHAVVVSEEAQPFLPRIRELVDFCRALENTAEAGIWVEDKMTTMSIHYRRADDPAAAREFIQQKIMPQVKKKGLALTEGRMVVEVRPPVAINKGITVGRLLDRLQARQAIYVGDDTTDVDALRELSTRKSADTVMVGVGVVSDEMPPELPEFADLLVKRSSGVEMVLQVLAGEEF